MALSTEEVVVPYTQHTHDHRNLIGGREGGRDRQMEGRTEGGTEGGRDGQRDTCYSFTPIILIED